MMKKHKPPYVSEISGRWHFRPSPQMRAAGVKGRSLGVATDPDRWKAAHEALEAAAVLVAAHQAGAGVAPTRPLSLDEVFAAWLSPGNGLLKRLSPKTIAHVRAARRALAPVLGAREAGALTLKAVEDWFWPRFERHPHATHQTLRNLRMALNWAKARGLIAGTPLRDCRFPSPGKRTRHLSQDEAAFLRRTAQEMGLRAVSSFIVLGVCLGQRPGDLLRLTGEMIDAHGVIRIRQQKTGADLEIPLRDWARRELAQEIRQGGPLIRREDGGACTLDHFERLWARVRAEAAKTRPELAEVWAADLRTTCVVWMAEGNATTPHIAAVTGHSLETVHRVLAHYLPPTKALASRGVAAMDLSALEAS